MSCSAERRTNAVSYAANKTAGSHNTGCPGTHLFHILTATCVTFACLCSGLATASTENPFLHSLVQATKVQEVKEVQEVQDLDLARLKTRIAEIENQGSMDVYTAELGEAYLELAAAFAAVDNNIDALKTYGQALQIIRVSEGLDSPNQLPVLQAQLDCLGKLRQWARYDDTLNLMYRISQDHFPAGDAARIKVLDQLGKWQLKAADEGLLDMAADKTRAVADLYEKELTQIETSGTAMISDYDLSSLQLGRAYARLATAKIAVNKPVGDYRSPTSASTRASTNCRSVRLAVYGDSQTCIAAPVPDLNAYQAPRDRKLQETGFYLEELRTAILDAAQTLENKRDFGNRDLLIEEFRFLAESYTKIVSLAHVN